MIEELSAGQVAMAIVGGVGTILATILGAFGIPAYVSLRRDIREQRKQMTDDKDKCDLVIGKLTGEIVALQLKADKDVLPQWHKNRNGTILWVNSIYIERFLAPFNKDAGDVLGKTDANIDFFSPQLKQVLSELDQEARDFGSGTSHGVQFNLNSNRKYTVVKELRVDPIMGGITFAGFACEER